MNANPSFALSSGHQRLQALVGSWRGEEEMSATQWTPAGPATAEVEATAEHGGLFVTQRYRQTRGGRESFASHNVFGFDPADGLTKMFAFDSMGFFPSMPASGTWNGDTLVLERSSPRGAARVSYLFDGADRYRTHLEFKPAGSDDWQDMAKGAFRRMSPTNTTSEQESP
jgi:hypothetical protein